MYNIYKTCAGDKEISQLRIVAQNREARETLHRLWKNGITMSAVDIQTKTKISIEFGKGPVEEF
ncbi:MAG: hypothetical protein U9R21_04325 [Candidatus Thermoplasmatota archaeon]|nr:hypothetical protein [Candidatus Thermoplasmatota archaeon]